MDNVINNGTNYADAFFEISYIKAFSTDSSTLVASVVGGSTILATATASVDSGSANEGLRILPGLVGVTVASIVAAFSWVML